MNKLAAKPYSTFYRRNLPHMQCHADAIFITFCTHNRAPIFESARNIVLDTCIYEHTRRMHLQCALVMPDHVHMIFHPLADHAGRYFSIREVMQAIKGVSSHKINKLLQRRGRLWQEEWFDRTLRKNDGLLDVVEYIRLNPMRRGLVSSVEKYQWWWLNPDIADSQVSPENQNVTRPLK